MFILQEKTQKNLIGGGASTPPTPVRLRVNILNMGYSQAHEVEFSSWELFQNMGRQVNDNKHYSMLCCLFLQTCPGCKKTKIHWLHTKPRLKAINDTFRSTLYVAVNLLRGQLYHSIQVTVCFHKAYIHIGHIYVREESFVFD